MKNVSGHCPVCRSKILEGVTLCPSCETPHHKECWEYNGKCAIFACNGKPDLATVPVQINLVQGRFIDAISLFLLILPLLVLMTIISADRMNVPSGEVVVVRHNWNSTHEYKAYDEHQSYYPLFFSVANYKKKSQFYFSTPFQFSDGIMANMSGSVEWEMPKSLSHIEWLHARFGSQNEINQKLIWAEVRNTLLRTARMMTSAECYADRGVKFKKLFSDQMQNGQYVVMFGDGVVKDPVTKREHRIETVHPVTRSCGTIIRDISLSQGFQITIRKASVDIGYPREFQDVMYEIERVQAEYMRQEQELRMNRRAYQKIFTDTFKHLLTFF